MMNRRELAKNGFFGLCAFLMGKLPKKPETVIALSTWGTDSDVTCHVSFPPGSVNTWGGWDFLKVADGYTLLDGTEIEHG